MPRAGVTATVVLLMTSTMTMAACGISDGEGSSTPVPSVAVSVTGAPTPTPSGPVLPSATPSASGLADGRHPAFITSVNSEGRLLTFDVIQFFTGAAAASAAAQDHASEVPPPNDIWIRDSSPALRTLPVAPDAPITVNTLGAAVTGDATQDLPVSLSTLAGLRHLSSGLFWLTFNHDVVTRVAEQYLP